MWKVSIDGNRRGKIAELLFIGVVLLFMFLPELITKSDLLKTEMNKHYYINLRNKYHPRNLNLIFILESPPVSGKYFYDVTGKKIEPLFSGMMKLLGYIPADKKDGLEFFKKMGYLLIDATYKQVNKLKGKMRNDTILADYKNLISDLKSINPNKNIPIILVKANICKILDKRLSEEGFNIANKGAVIPFPSHGQQKRFHSKALEILSELRL